MEVFRVSWVDFIDTWNEFFVVTGKGRRVSITRGRGQGIYEFASFQKESSKKKKKDLFY